MAQEMLYRLMNDGEWEDIKDIDASQLIKRAWRMKDGVLRLVEINYFEPGFPDGVENHMGCLKEILEGKGFAIGAYTPQGKIAGFCAVDMTVFGSAAKYVLLDEMFISKEYRRAGVGKRLFLLAGEKAKAQGAEKFYICSASSEETVAFYRSLGCVDAVEINETLFNKDPRDVQLEYTL